ncbi:MAG TPA: S53 family peptidase [Acetobacteraceae bacterium]|nr:S53 family peptidase [Acetobacteraceae bacterium]
MAQHVLVGSERQPVPGARAIGRADPAERLEVSVILRSGAADALREKVRKLASGDRSEAHVERADFAQHYGARKEDIDAVGKFAAAHGLAVVEQNAARRTVVLSGTVAAFNRAFGVDLRQFEHAGGSYRGRTGPVHLPDELKDAVDAVLGLDNRPVARPHFRGRATRGNFHWHANAGAAASFDPGSLAALYGFPAGDGQGECVAIIELGGGYRTADLQSYFAGLGISATPNVSAVSVDHGMNLATGDANGPDGEVMLDIEVVGAIAPAARIVVYFAPNTDAGFLDAITAAAHDATNRPSVISISWGGPEAFWTTQAMTCFDNALQSAAALGITVCVAAGDNGSGDGAEDGADHVDFPASSPHVLACGGTSLRAANGTISGEAVWNDGAKGGAGGGGVSGFFPLPAWQAGLTVVKAGHAGPLTMRGVPDVSGNADPDTGYNVRIDGADTVIGGTSAVAPLWAGLIARINAAKGGSAGFINPSLYRAPAAMHDISRGNNGDFAAAAGWDACTGLGSPNGTRIAAALETPPTS